MTPEQVQAERARMDARAKATARMGELEHRLDAHADALSATSTLLDEERRKNVTLTRLVVRMGEAVVHLALDVYYTCPDYPFTISGQRQYDAAMHEAEGEPEGHGLVEDVQ